MSGLQDEEDCLAERDAEIDLSLFRNGPSPAGGGEMPQNFTGMEFPITGLTGPVVEGKKRVPKRRKSI